MKTYDSAMAIIKALNDDRSKLSALYSLYCSSLTVAEEERQLICSFYEQLIDLKNDANLISASLMNVKKSERVRHVGLNKTKIKRLNLDLAKVNDDFNQSTEKYRKALNDCNALKTEYRHEVGELCKQFKSLVDKNKVEEIVIKGYKQQVKIIKAIFERIDEIVLDHNEKMNQLSSDSDRFVSLYESANVLVGRMQTTA